jgi:hypothetical protein
VEFALEKTKSVNYTDRDCTVYLHVLGKGVYHVPCEKFEALGGMPSGRIVQLALDGPLGRVLETVKIYYRRHKDGVLHVFTLKVAK